MRAGFQPGLTGGTACPTDQQQQAGKNGQTSGRLKVGCGRLRRLDKRNRLSHPTSTIIGPARKAKLQWPAAGRLQAAAAGLPAHSEPQAVAGEGQARAAPIPRSSDGRLTGLVMTASIPSAIHWSCCGWDACAVRLVFDTALSEVACWQ